MEQAQPQSELRHDGETSHLLRRAALWLGRQSTRAGWHLIHFGLGPRAAAKKNGDLTYEDRVASEIENFNPVTDVHDLPPIFHYWSHKYVRPRLEEVLGVCSPDEFFVEHIADAALRKSPVAVRVASLGAGNADLELRLAVALLARGIDNFQFLCLDLNQTMLRRGAEAARLADLADRFEFVEMDVTRWEPSGTFDVVIANHMLHHLIPLEEVFDRVHQALGPTGVFLAADMIGRNGHMRWPEALSIVRSLWKELPNRCKFNHQLSRYEPLYQNWDCSKVGFEGIRSQDILPLLVKKFHFEQFVAFGNLTDVFVDRAFGHNFSPERPEDRAFIDRVAELGDHLIDEGTLKPTQMIAAMRTIPYPAPRHHKHWTPEFCVRWPS